MMYYLDIPIGVLSYSLLLTKEVRALNEREHVLGTHD